MTATVYGLDYCDQGSEAWRELHRGIPTASEFSKVMAGRGPRGGETKESVQRSAYLRMLAAEIVTGEPREPEWFGNRHTQRGQAREAEALGLYALVREVEPMRVAFVRNEICGCSPDALVGGDGGVEVKDVLPHRQIERLQARVIPPEHYLQVLGGLLVTGFSWWDFVSHSRGLPPLIVRMWRRDVEEQIEDLRLGIERFCEERDRLVVWLRAQ